MNEAPQEPELTAEQEAKLEAETEKLNSYELARIRMGLVPAVPSGPGQIIHSARLQARAASHAESVDRGQMDPAFELARVLRGALEHQEPQTLDDDLFRKQ